jgi:hypothetical protein
MVLSPFSVFTNRLRLVSATYQLKIEERFNFRRDSSVKQFEGSGLERVKIIARYADGRVAKGFCQDFSPTNPQFHLVSAKAGAADQATKVLVKDLKAVFFVRDFEGNPQYKKCTQPAEEPRPSGRKMEVPFADGEVLVGSTMGYDRQRPGFFFFPADPGSNNLRVFAVSAGLKSVRFL